MPDLEHARLMLRLAHDDLLPRLRLFVWPLVRVFHGAPCLRHPPGSAERRYQSPQGADEIDGASSVHSTIDWGIWIAPGCQDPSWHGRTSAWVTESTDNPLQLLQRTADGDRESFARFYDRYASLVFTFALRLLQMPSEAEDLLQDVFLQVWRQASSYSQERGSPEPGS